MTPELEPFDQTDPSDLRCELAKLRSMLALAAGNIPLERSICDSIKGLAAEYDKQQARRSLYVHRSAMMRWAQLFAGVVTTELNQLPEEQRDEITDRILAWLRDPGNAPGNDPGEVKALTVRER